MPFFTPTYISFFQELTQNNQREWFHANKKTYEKEVKAPFKAFVQALIDRAGEIDPEINIDPKNAIFRINRDIRFSKDKSPYKLFNSAIISPGGKKEKEKPEGFYIELSAEHVRVYGGAYMISKEPLMELRELIEERMEEFNALISEEKFVATYGGIQGDRNKRLPKHLQQAAEKQPLIYNKQFYFFTEMPAEHILSDNLVDQVIEAYLIGKPVTDFLLQAWG